MNFVCNHPFVARTSKSQAVLYIFLTTLLFILSICLVGCSGQVRLPSAAQLAEFRNAGPIGPIVDLNRLVRARMGGGPYRVVPGDVLELSMPTILQIVMADSLQTLEKVTPFTCRVSQRGGIALPMVGEIEVAGKSLAEIELAVIDAYHPKYVGTRPSLLARVLEYKTAKVSITGAVRKAGVYSLRSDQMSLVALLMEAGGIIDEGAALIRIIRSDEAVAGNPGRVEDITEETTNPEKPEPLVLPVKGLNIPFADVALQDGDSIEVERLKLPLFAVIGLVNKSGNFPYPPDVQYNLMQALAFAGGLYEPAEPRYATVYRLKSDGTIVSATFKVANGSASNILIKPGDIVAVEHTPRTRTNLFLDRMFRITIGVYAPVQVLD